MQFSKSFLIAQGKKGKIIRNFPLVKNAAWHGRIWVVLFTWDVTTVYLKYFSLQKKNSSWFCYRQKLIWLIPLFYMVTSLNFCILMVDYLFKSVAKSLMKFLTFSEVVVFRPIVKLVREFCSYLQTEYFFKWALYHKRIILQGLSERSSQKY